MAGQLVVGLFDSLGSARDAHNRLHTEGMPWSEMALRVIHEADPVPESMEPELAAFSVSPLIWVDVERTYAQYIKDGETVVVVNAPTAIDVEFVTDIMALYDPLMLDVLSPRAATTELDGTARPQPDDLVG
jgi:hypothetical protein